MTTIAQLQASVDAWLIRDDVAVTGSDFTEILRLAEAEIATEYRFVVQETSTDLSFTGRSADLPADFLEARVPFIDDQYRSFNYKTPQALRQSAEWENGRAGMSYTIEGGSKDLSATGDDRVAVTIAGPASVASPLTVTVYYYRRFAALDPATPTDTNWLLLYQFNVILFETLFQAAIYIQEAELVDKYGAMVTSLRQRIAKQENRKRFGAMPKQSYNNPHTIV